MEGGGGGDCRRKSKGGRGKESESCVLFGFERKVAYEKKLNFLQISLKV